MQSASDLKDGLEEYFEALFFSDDAMQGCFEKAHEQHFDEIDKFTKRMCAKIPDFTKKVKVRNYTGLGDLKTEFYLSKNNKIVICTFMETKIDRVRFLTQMFDVTGDEAFGMTLKAFNVRRG